MADAVDLVVAIVLIVIVARAMGWVVTLIGQPRVMGEILAGILLGPSVLGLVWPNAMDAAFDPSVRDALGVLAQIGLVLFMFMAGLELDTDRLRSQGRMAVMVSTGSIVVPLSLGAALGFWMYPRYGQGGDALGFVLFIGSAMAITALPVLVRIVKESGLGSSRIGGLVVACAAANDVVAWFLLAAVLAIWQANGPLGVLWTISLTAVFTASMLLVVRPALKRVDGVPTLVAVGLALLSALVTELIGVHAIFGAFLAGVVLHGSVSTRARAFVLLEKLTMVILLPVFFVVAGLSTRVDRLNSVRLWVLVATVVVVATVGKVLGAGLAASWAGESRTDALSIGVLMNTRGLTEIVLLTVGLDRGVIGPELFSVFVIMALATTFMAAPMLHIVRRPSGEHEIGAAADGLGDPNLP